MAKKNKVEIDVKVDDKGTTKKLGLESKKAAKGLDETSKSARTADRNIKGTAQASSNATKNFSKMAQGTGGLVAAYATLAANIFAISAAFQFLKRAGDLRALEQAQVQYANKTGLSMKLLTSRIQEATGGIVSFQEASQAAAIGRAAGLSPDQLERLGAAAKNAAAALGRDTTDAFQRLTRGAIKAEPELLDELGIIVRLEKATTDYKNALNITGRELTTFEKTQAVVNATLSQAEEKFDDIGNNVNEIARLGKAFDDLVKNIQRSVVGPAEFIANVFTKNIFALTAAFSLLGINIVKSLAPAGPAIANLADEAEASKKRIRAIADPRSKTGAAVQAGDFSNMKTLERAAASKTSKVINLSKMERAAIQRDLKIIQANHMRTMAANTTGFKKYTLQAIANMKLMQAEHGKVMGTLRAGISGFATFASRAMNAIAILGVITLAISMAKELLDLLKSDELKAAESRAERLKNRFSEQNKAVKEMLEDLERATTPMGRLAQDANMISQLSLTGLSQGLKGFNTGLGLPQHLRTPIPKQATDTTTLQFSNEGADILKQNKQYRKLYKPVLEEQITSLKLISQVAKNAGQDTSKLDSKLGEITTSMDKFGNANLHTLGGLKDFNVNVRRLQTLFPDARGEAEAFTISLGSQLDALKLVNSQAEVMIGLRKKLAGKDTPGEMMAASFRASALGLKNLFSDSAVASKFLDKETFVNVKTQLGVTDESLDNKTMGELQTILTGKAAGLESRALTAATKPAENQERLNKSLQVYLPFLKEQAKHEKQLVDLAHQKFLLQKQLDDAEAGNITLSDVQIKAIDAQKNAIDEQMNLVKRNFSDIGRLGNAIGQSLESSLVSVFQKIGEEGYKLKNAFADIAQSILKSMAQVVAQLMAKKLLTTMLGSTDFGNFLGIEARTGGVFSKGREVQGYSTGGIARGPHAGYPAVLHGTEAVVPLPNGKQIPVEMRGGASQQNNIVVNVSSDGKTQTQSNTGGMDQEKLGKSIALAVQEEMQNQKRSGGILNPYGVA